MNEHLKNGYEKVKNESSRLRKEAHTRTVGYIVAAFGLVVGLAWNDAVKSLIEYFLPNNSNSLWAKFGYAGLITLLFILITTYILKVDQDTSA